jgi:hypothetical protein
MNQDDIDIEKLRVDPEFIQQMAGGPDGKSKRKGWRRNFTLVPREWELRLLGAKRVVTYKLGAELLYRHWLGGGKSIAVTNAVANAANLSARSKSNALTELERLGLITVDRSLRRSPQVTLQHVPRI